MDIANPVANPVAWGIHFFESVADYLSFKICKKAKIQGRDSWVEPLIYH